MESESLDMGGFGSGRWGGHTKAFVVEDCQVLDLSMLVRHGILSAGACPSGTLRWGAGTAGEASVGYEVYSPDTATALLRLHYSFRGTGGEEDYLVGLIATMPYFGGRRWWLCCPAAVGGRACGRRVRKLFLPPGGRVFACRKCHGLTFTACQKSHRYDSLYRKMAATMGCDVREAKRALDMLAGRY
jgi:hypothetical protein